MASEHLIGNLGPLSVVRRLLLSITYHALNILSQRITLFDIKTENVTVLRHSKTADIKGRHEHNEYLMSHYILGIAILLDEFTTI